MAPLLTLSVGAPIRQARLARKEPISYSVPSGKWTMSEDGHTLISAAGFDEIHMRWFRLPSGSPYAEKTVKGPLNDIICLYGTTTALVATLQGIWLVAPIGTPKLILRGVVFERLCQRRTSSVDSLCVAGFANYGASNISIKERSAKVIKLSGFLPIPINNSTPLLAMPNGSIELPASAVAVQKDRLALSNADQGQPPFGIYDVMSNTNRLGDSILFKSHVDASDATVFQWLSGNLWLREPTGEMKKLSPRNDSHHRIVRCFLTNDGSLWCELIQGTLTDMAVLEQIKVLY